jgi:hypothetical protein
MHETDYILKCAGYMNDRHCAIGLCTCRRPEQMSGCLQSLGAMDRPENIPLCLIIADNDPTGSAESVVDTFSRDTDIPVLGNAVVHVARICSLLGIHITWNEYT